MPKSKHRKKQQARSPRSIASQLLSSRACDGCGTQALTVQQGSGGPTTLKSGRILCHKCRDLELPDLPWKLIPGCEGEGCLRKAEELHPCHTGCVQLFCKPHHLEVHFDEEWAFATGDCLLRWAACSEGIPLCMKCPELAEVSCHPAEAPVHLYCDSCHEQYCVNGGTDTVHILDNGNTRS